MISTLDSVLGSHPAQRIKNIFFPRSCGYSRNLVLPCIQQSNSRFGFSIPFGHLVWYPINNFNSELSDTLIKFNINHPAFRQPCYGTHFKLPLLLLLHAVTIYPLWRPTASSISRETEQDLLLEFPKLRPFYSSEKWQNGTSYMVTRNCLHFGLESPSISGLLLDLTKTTV